MRTNIEIDENLLSEAMAASQTGTKKDAVEAALRLTVRLKNQARILDLFGKVQWDGDLDAMRQGRFLDWGDADDSGSTGRQQHRAGKEV